MKFLVTLFILIFKHLLFPENWKHSYICPVLKKCGPALFNDYRPISILIISSNIVEIFLYREVHEPVRSGISENQLGFVQRESSATNLASLT